LPLLTNIDREHLDFIRALRKIKEAFLKFANIVPFTAVRLFAATYHVREITPLVKRKMITYGIELPAELQRPVR